MEAFSESTDSRCKWPERISFSVGLTLSAYSVIVAFAESKKSAVTALREATDRSSALFLAGSISKAAA